MQKYLKYALPLIIFVVLVFFYNILENIITDVLVYTYQIWFDIFINSNGQELLRQVDITNSEPGIIKFLTAFVNIQDISASQVKTVEIELFNEIGLPIIFFISAIFIFINKTNYKQFIIYFFILLLFLWLKNVIVIYDNYTHPEYILKDIIFPFKQLVYYTNSILQKVGTSFSMMISVIFVVIFITLKTEILGKIIKN